jgi:class 3 adenylate cyclase
MYPTIESSVNDIFYATWNITEGTVVPKTDDIVMKNGGRRVDATYLYADLAGSSKLAQTMLPETTAIIVRAYINSAARLIRDFGGEIRSFDGDRVMGIYMGVDKNRKAVRTALAINWAVNEVIKKAIDGKWSDVPKTYSISHGVGIDTGEALIVRGGARDNNDLISIGHAPNDAAKLSDYRGSTINITKAVYDDLDNDHWYSTDGQRNMWTSSNGYAALGRTTSCYHSSWWWEA